MDDNDTASSSTLGKRRRTNNNNTKDDINTSHQINNKQAYKQIPSEIFATNILSYLDYQSILSLSATCKHILHNILPLITTLHINKSIQMNGLIVHSRRFRDNVKSINIYSLLVQRSEDDFDFDDDSDRIIKYYDVDLDTVMRFIPFISQCPNLQHVFIGGMVRGQVIHLPNRSQLWDDEGDVNRVQTLMDMISGAFRVGGVLPTGLQVRGLRCPYSGNNDDEANDVRTCEVCERACQSLPLEQVVNFANGGIVSDDIDCDFHRPRCSLTHVCLERSQIESIIESRPGGNALLRSNARFMYLLGRGSVYEIPSEDSNDLIVPNYQHPDGGNRSSDESISGSPDDESMSGPDGEQLPGSDDEGSDESDDEDDSSSSSSSNEEEDMANEEHYEPPHGPSLYIVKYTEDEMEELQRVLEYSGLNTARIPQGEVTKAIMQSFARDDKVPPPNQCYLSKESIVYLRDVIGLSIDEEVFSTPDVAVDYLIQLTQAVSDAPPIQADCIILLCKILKKLRNNKILHQEAVLMLSGCCMDQLVDSMCEGYTIVARQAAIILLGEIAWNNTRNCHFKKRVVDAAIHLLVDSLSSKSTIIVMEAVRTIGKIAKDSDTICRTEIFKANAINPLLMLMKSSEDVSILVEVSNTLWMTSERLSCFGYGKMLKCLKPLSEFLMTDKLSPVGDDQIELWECTRNNICFTMYCICLHNRCAINTVIETGILPHLMSIDEGKHILGMLVKYEKFWNYTAVVSFDLPKMIPFLSNSNVTIKTIASRAIYNAIFYAEKDHIPDIVTQLGCQLPIVILMLSNNTDNKIRRYDQEAGIMKTLVSGGCIRSLCDMINDNVDKKIVESALKALQAVSVVHISC